MNRITHISAHLTSQKPQRDFSKYFQHYSLPDIEIRELNEDDDKNGFLSILGQLTKVSEVPHEDFKNTLNKIKSSPNMHLIIVAADKATKKIVGAGTIIIEKKLLRNLGKIGHIEDIVVDSNLRGKNLGRIIVECLTRIAFEEEGVYKVILDCSDKNVGFYQKLNYKLVQNDMGIYNEVFGQKYSKV